MQINIISVGKLKEKYWVNAQDEYMKRLSKFARVNLIEIKDESNKLDKGVVLKKEKESILSKLNGFNKENNYVIVLAIEGEKISSEVLSLKMEDIKNRGYSQVSFIIGGSYGIDEEIKRLANYSLSFSDLTFPHQLFKIMLLEQIYRSFKIENNESYHK